MKPHWYYGCTRTEILPFLPKRIGRHLDIGCASGRFGRLVKEKYNCESWGIEYDTTAAESARDNLDVVYSGDCLSIIPSIDKKFDCITILDVFEHIVEGDKLLAAIHDVMDRRSTLVLSVPNILFVRVLADMIIHRDFKYQDSGVLDRTHVRFFTKKSIVRQVNSAGFSVRSVHGINPTKHVLLFNVLNMLTLKSFDESRHQQFVVVATKES